MFPIADFAARFEALLEEFDALAQGADMEALDDLNAEFEDMLLALSDIRPAGDGWREELSDAAEDLEAIADDYDALALRPGAPALAAPAGRLHSLVALLRNNLG